MTIIHSGHVRVDRANSRFRRTSTTRGSHARFDVPHVDVATTEAASELAAPTTLGLLAMQEAVSSTAWETRHRQALCRGADLLDRLEDLRLDLLAGAATIKHLDGLVRTLEAECATSDDPRLNALLAEIELRAAVEVAKRKRCDSPPEQRASHPDRQYFDFLSKS